MNYNTLLLNYIDACPEMEPIFIEDIKSYFQEKLNNVNIDKVFKTINVYINRLVKQNKLIQFLKGIYYKPSKGVFGNKKLNINKVIDRKYIVDKSGKKGYISGAYLFNQLGLTTQVPKEMLIVTNECPNKNDYNNKNLGVIIRKPKILINDDNYRYLQLFDILNNKDNINIEIDNEKEIIYKFIKENKLELDKLFDYACESNNKKAIVKLYEMGERNE